MRPNFMLVILSSMALTLASLGVSNAKQGSRSESGIASVYSTESGHGTASGQRLNPQALTAAHKSLPFGTQVRVTNRNNGKSVVVRINDRGPFVRGRVIDLTPAGARALGFLRPRARHHRCDWLKTPKTATWLSS